VDRSPVNCIRSGGCRLVGLVVVCLGTDRDRSNLKTPAQVPSAAAALATKYTRPRDRQYLPDAGADFDVVYAILLKERAPVIGLAVVPVASARSGMRPARRSASQPGPMPLIALLARSSADCVVRPLDAQTPRPVTALYLPGMVGLNRHIAILAQRAIPRRGQWAHRERTFP
jgi:hypothetical protein